MNQDNPFKPPVAAVADVHVDTTASRRRLIVLAVAALIQLAWTAAWTPVYAELAGAGALQPLGMLFVAFGALCLYAGILRALVHARVRGRRGEPLFVGAAGFSVCGLAEWWRPMSLPSLMPVVLGVLLAVAGWLIVRARANATQAADPR